MKLTYFFFMVIGTLWTPIFAFSDQIEMELNEERIHALLSHSSDLRRTLSQDNSRNVASLSHEDNQRLEEFDSLMKDQSETDYLELAERIK